MAKRATAAPQKPAGEAGAAKRVENAVTTVAEVLLAAGWDAKRTDTEASVSFDVEIGGKEVIRLAHASVFTAGERLALLFIFRKKAVKARRPEVAELITRLNYGMITGGFEMDMDGGEVRYRFGLDFSGVELHPLLVRNAVLTSLDALETYEQAVQDVITGAASPKQALAAAEAAMAERGAGGTK